MRLKLVAAMATVLFVFGAVRVDCQTSSGSIAGEIKDKNGANIAQATVTITQVDTGRTIRVKTNANGAYNLPALEPGHYRIVCTRQGFGTTEINDVELHTAETLALNLTLQVGSVSQQVTVVAGEDLVTRSTPTLSATVPSALITDLPLPDRSALEVATLIGGVQGDPQYEGGIQSEIPGIFTQPITPGASLAIVGGRPGTTSQLVDGFDTTLSAYPRAGITLSRASINDVTVQRGAQEAEYGRNGGGIVNQATKSGSNQYHGIFDWRHEEPFLEASTYSSSFPAAQHQNLFTALLSGPVPTWHDVRSGFRDTQSHKTFLLLSFEPEWVENKTFNRARLPSHLSELIQDYDWADEVLHARIGRDWLVPELGSQQQALAFGDKVWSKVLVDWGKYRSDGLTQHANWWPRIYREACKHWGAEPDPRLLAYNTTYENMRPDMKQVTAF